MFNVYMYVCIYVLCMYTIMFLLPILYVSINIFILLNNLYQNIKLRTCRFMYEHDTYR